MKKILDTSESTGSTFSLPRGHRVATILTGHSGGTWTMQFQDPDGTWVDIGDQEFDGDGYWAWYASHELSYRLTGGTAGAKAWIVGIDDVVYQDNVMHGWR